MMELAILQQIYYVDLRRKEFYKTECQSFLCLLKIKKEMNSYIIISETSFLKPRWGGILVSYYYQGKGNLPKNQTL